MIEKKIFYTWNEFFDDIYLAIIPALKPLKNRFSGVWGQPRGGLIIAVILSHHLELPLITWPRIVMKILALFGIGKRILIADDIADTGKTLWLFRKHAIVTCFFHRQSKITPVIWIREKKNGQWIIFPWETGKDK